VVIDGVLFRVGVVMTAAVESFTIPPITESFTTPADESSVGLTPPPVPLPLFFSFFFLLLLSFLSIILPLPPPFLLTEDDATKTPVSSSPPPTSSYPIFDDAPYERSTSPTENPDTGDDGTVTNFLALPPPPRVTNLSIKSGVDGTAVGNAVGLLRGGVARAERRRPVVTGVEGDRSWRVEEAVVMEWESRSSLRNMGWFGVGGEKGVVWWCRLLIVFVGGLVVRGFWVGLGCYFCDFVIL